jgi:hypothetical protein
MDRLRLSSRARLFSLARQASRSALAINCHVSNGCAAPLPALL